MKEEASADEETEKKKRRRGRDFSVGLEGEKNCRVGTRKRRMGHR